MGGSGGVGVGGVSWGFVEWLLWRGGGGGQGGAWVCKCGGEGGEGRMARYFARLGGGGGGGGAWFGRWWIYTGSAQRRKEVRKRASLLWAASLRRRAFPAWREGARKRAFERRITRSLGVLRWKMAAGNAVNLWGRGAFLRSRCRRVHGLGSRVEG